MEQKDGVVNALVLGCVDGGVGEQRWFVTHDTLPVNVTPDSCEFL